MRTCPFSLSCLKDTPGYDLAEGLTRAGRVVSYRVGIVNGVEFTQLTPEDPAIYRARSNPANIEALYGLPTMNFGDGVAMNPDRAIIKSVCESVERYCGALYDKDRLAFSSYEALGENAVHPRNFALFTEEQYAEPGFLRARMTPQTPIRWVRGYSLVSEKEIYVPAGFVYVPYVFDKPAEPGIDNPISTGLACGPNFAAAICKAILEVVERDAFMITWQNKIAAPAIDLPGVDDPAVQHLLRAMEGSPFSIHAAVLTLDIKVPVILGIVQSKSDDPPYTMIGMGTDLDPRRALLQALEEAYFGLLGISLFAKLKPDFRPTADYSNVVNLDLHGLAHAVSPELRSSMDFLTESGNVLSMNGYLDLFGENGIENVQDLVKRISNEGYDVIIVDLTTPDVDEVGFKVVRAIIPGFQPLDVDHARRHLGRERLYHVAHKLGLAARPLREEDLNPLPHPFP